MNPAERLGEQAVPRHREPDPGLPELENQQRGDHAHHGPKQDGEAHPGQVEPPQLVDHGGGVVQGVPAGDAGEDHDHRDVEKRADEQGGDDADGEIAPGVPGLLRRGGDGVEADVGEEDDGPAREHPRPAVGREGPVVARVDEAHAGHDEGQDGHDLQDDHHVVRLGRLPDAPHQDHGERHDDQEGREVEAEVPARRESRGGGRQVGRKHPLRGQGEAEEVEQVDQVLGEPDSNRHVADRVLQDEVPADDPGHQLAHGGVGVRVGAARDGDHGGQLRVAEGREGADHGHQHEGQGDRGTGPRAPEGGGLVDEVFQERRVQDGGELELLPRDGGAHHGEDARADHGPDPQGGEGERSQGLLEAVLGALGVRYQLVDGFPGEELVAQGRAPFMPRRRDCSVTTDPPLVSA